MSLLRLSASYERLLSPRERQILNARLNGCGMKQVAADLGISENTARHHSSRGLRKLQIQCALQLAGLARYRRGCNLLAENGIALIAPTH